jgi:uncharacterized protein YegL
MALGRLTVFILIDTSGSMAGEPMTSLLGNLRLLKDAMSKNDLIHGRVDVCLVGFSGEARLLAPPVSLDDIEFPADLETAGSTATGAAIDLMLEVRSRPSEMPSLCRLAPVALLVSDGVATDDFDAAIGRVDAASWSARVAWGLSGADEGQLERFVGERQCRSSHLSLFGQDAGAGAVTRFCLMLSLILGNEDSGGNSASLPGGLGPTAPSARAGLRPDDSA